MSVTLCPNKKHVPGHNIVTMLVCSACLPSDDRCSVLCSELRHAQAVCTQQSVPEHHLIMLLSCLQKWYTTFGNHDMVINGEGP